MYTNNIPTNISLKIIPKYLCEHKKDTEPLISAVELFFRNNMFQFRNLILKQLLDTAMGVSPAPSFSTIFFGHHEIEFLP